MELLKFGHNQAIMDRLVAVVRARPIIPFVGAGLSATYRLPQWDELLNGLALTDGDRTELKRLLGDNDYEGAAEYVLHSVGPTRLQIVLRQKLDIQVDARKRTALARLLELPAGPVITTNFDRVIEAVFAAAQIALEPIIGNRPDAIRDAFLFCTNALVKLHGDIGDSSDRVLAASEYEKEYAGWLEKVLRNLASQPLLFLGYSLKNDRPVRVLERLVREGHVDTRHFAILPVPEKDDELAARNRWLSEELKIDAIWYPAGKHDSVEQLLAWLVEQVPADRRRNYKRNAGPRHLDLPAPPFLLYGREQKLAQLVGALETAGVVIVEGNRGAGKTAFALNGVRQFLDKEVFGALVWVTASGQKEQLRLSFILKLISRTIDFPFAPDTTTAEYERKLAEELERKGIRCLLVVDNYETVSDEEIHRFLFERRPERLTVLITSTGHLQRKADLRIEMGELEKSDALLLFKARLTRDGLEQESNSELERLYDVVGGNPLALEWLVGQLRTGKQLPPLLDSLSQGKADVLPKVFNQSWIELGDDPRALLATMAIFVRPAPEEGLRAVLNLAPERFDEALAHLMRTYMAKRLRLQGESVTTAVATRKYFMHPFTRDFLEGQRETLPTVALYRRAAEFYLHYVDERGGTPSREEATDHYELNDQKDNMLGVLHGCAKAGNEEALVLLVQSMARWLFIESHWADLEGWGNRAVQLALRLDLQHEAGRILNEIGRVYSNRSQYVKAEEAFTTALRLAETEPADLWALAYIRHHRSEQMIRQRQFESAKELLAVSLAGFRALNGTREVIGVQYRLATLALEMGNLPEAKRLAEEGVENTQNERWDRLQGFNHRVLGDLAVRQNDLLEARFRYQTALKLVPKTDMRIQALIELSLARLEHASGKREAARDLAVAAQDHFEKIGMRKEAEEASRLVLSIDQ